MSGRSVLLFVNQFQGDVKKPWEVKVDEISSTNVKLCVIPGGTSDMLQPANLGIIPYMNRWYFNDK